MRIKGDRFFCVKGQFGNFVAAYEQFVGFARHRFERRSINHFLNRLNAALGLLGRQFEFVRVSFGKRLFAEPKESRLETGKLEGRRAFERRNRAASNKNLLSQGDANGFTSRSGIARRGIPSLNSLYCAGFVSR